MPAGVQLFSLLAANPSLLRLVADIMGTAPRLACCPCPPPASARCRARSGILRRGADAGQAQGAGAKIAGTSRPTIRTRSTALASSGASRGSSSASASSQGRCRRRRRAPRTPRIAETLIETLAGRVEAELERQHGRVPGGQAAVVAMGKLGGREMTATSDLDLITVYDFAGEGAQSEGAKSLSGSQYYMRFTQRLIAALSAQTAEGSLYQVDMRLRPSGNQGPVATSLASFIDYQRNSAWTWEHLALTRARVVSGPPELRQIIERTISRGAAPAAGPGASRRRSPRHARQDRGGEGRRTTSGTLRMCRGGLIDHRVPRPVPANRQRARSSRGARPEHRGCAQQTACRRECSTLAMRRSSSRRRRSITR